MEHKFEPPHGVLLLPLGHMSEGKDQTTLPSFLAKKWRELAIQQNISASRFRLLLWNLFFAFWCKNLLDGIAPPWVSTDSYGLLGAIHIKKFLDLKMTWLTSHHGLES